MHQVSGFVKPYKSRRFRLACFSHLFKRVTGMDSLKEKIVEMEREEIIKALRDCGWVMARAARKLGITERMIGYKMKKYGIRREELTAVNSKQ